MKRNEIEKLLLAHNVKPTAQRACILNYLLNTNSHPTADDILKEVAKLLPVPISRATVYNTLNLLVSKSVIKEVVTEPGKVRFDAKMNDHHHFVDLNTGQVIDVDAELDDSLKVNVDPKFKIDSYQITFFGEIASQLPTSDQALNQEELEPNL